MLDHILGWQRNKSDTLGTHHCQSVTGLEVSSKEKRNRKSRLSQAQPISDTSDRAAARQRDGARRMIDGDVAAGRELEAVVAIAQHTVTWYTAFVCLPQVL